MSELDILIIEDSPSLARTYQGNLEKAGKSVRLAANGREARAAMACARPALVLLDLKLPDVDGMDLLREFSVGEDAPAFVVITANGSITTAVEAMREGAIDFLVKPFDRARLLTTVEASTERVSLRRAVRAHRFEKDRREFAEFLGSSPPMKAVYRTIEAASRTEANVLITGESGTGKELAARAVHQLSRRSRFPFHAINCGAIPRDLMESEIFGHVKGAFTGATADRDGAVSMADGGVLFLDELAEMPVELQVKLLRLVQSGTYQRVGESRMRKANVRFVAATNRDPRDAILDGALREDLYYRLNVIPCFMPPLRLRGADVIDLARHFLEQYSVEEERTFQTFDQAAEDALLACGWPGNVRQLQNVVRNAVVMNEGDEITLDMLPAEMMCERSRRVSSGALGGESRVPSSRGAGPAGIQPLAIVERDTIEGAIQVCGGNVQRAARLLDIDPSTIYRKRKSWESGSSFDCEAP